MLPSFNCTSPRDPTCPPSLSVSPSNPPTPPPVAGWSPDLSSSPLTFAAFPSPSFLHLDPTAPTLLVCSKPSLSDADNAVLTSMDLKDVAGATHEASTVTIHHYPVAEVSLGC